MAGLYLSAQAASAITDRVLVGVSCGKDSVVTLDLCVRHFKHVEAFFMYYVKGLEFQEAALRHYEKRYGITIHRIPHFMLSEWLRYGTFRLMDFDTPIVSVRETYDYLREKTGIYWIACGERISDSIVRRAMIKHSGSIDADRGRFYPVAEWKKADIVAYIRQRRLFLGPESAKLGFSFRSLMPLDLMKIREHFPDDFNRIKVWFPLVEASIKQYEYAKNQ
ncbi:MAG: phosphoadenosine phosphosulfate reductase family protein [Desulfovibrio sp.]